MSEFDFEACKARRDEVIKRIESHANKTLLAEKGIESHMTHDEQDRDGLIKVVEKIREACTEVQNDWAPEQPPYEADELIRQIRLLIEGE